MTPVFRIGRGLLKRKLLITRGLFVWTLGTALRSCPPRRVPHGTISQNVGNTRQWEWSTKKEAAAALLAEDSLSIRRIGIPAAATVFCRGNAEGKPKCTKMHDVF